MLPLRKLLSHRRACASRSARRKHWPDGRNMWALTKKMPSFGTVYGSAPVACEEGGFTRSCYGPELCTGGHHVGLYETNEDLSPEGWLMHCVRIRAGISGAK
jgi:hypothetical protein